MGVNSGGKYDHCRNWEAFYVTIEVDIPESWETAAVLWCPYTIVGCRQDLQNLTIFSLFDFNFESNKKKCF